MLLQASTQWEVTKGYVGCARLVMPLTNLNSEPCSLELDEALLTIRPRQPGNASADEAAAQEPSEEPADSFLGGTFFDFEEGRKGDGDLSLESITAGVTRIAGGIETILQKLKLQVKLFAHTCI